MKATSDVPEELYRRVKAKSALEGRGIHDIAEELFRLYVGPEAPPEGTPSSDPERLLDGKPFPPWFGLFRRQAETKGDDDLAAIRESIPTEIARERNP